ncbi:hypothetical protein [Peribacillus butanolivorans]|uniref:hypothetical protein n=1 Tax=Peribacillus butanolivorans TaxID=421767 RepID=UPI00367289A3
MERRVGDIATCFADTEKAEKELNWSAARELEKCVKTHGDVNQTILMDMGSPV